MGQGESTCTAPPRGRQHAALQSLHLRAHHRDVAAHVEGDSLLIGRHIRHSAFSLANIHFSQSDEDEVGQ
jgi:hypothetical protein